tara:strand:- start:817 stop:1431 length:615 start_codon:yes stop_codon:yes gene_type:complete
MGEVFSKLVVFLVALAIVSLMVLSCDYTPQTAQTSDPSNPAQNMPVIDWEDCSGKMNDHPCDFTLMDQNGLPWQLYEHTGSIIVLDISTIWCGACQFAAMQAEENHDLYKDRGVIWVTVILENYYGQKPTLGDIREWATVFDIEDAVVLAGNLDLLDPLSLAGWYVDSLPLFIVIDRDMITTYRLDGFNEEKIQAWVEELLENE